MNLEYLLNSLPQNYSAVDRDLITRAYHFTDEAHSAQTRASGETYLTHCVEVARTLAELKVTPAVVLAGLLHDTLSNTDVTPVDLQREFGDEIAKLIDGITRLTNLPKTSEVTHPNPTISPEDISLQEEVEALARSKSRKHDAANETIRKMYLAMGDDVRVIIIKLADRLHTMRTLGNIKPESKQRRYAQETLDIFAPLANRLGIWQIKWQLEDLAFRYVNPEKYTEIAEKLAERREDRERVITDIVNKLSKILDDANIKAQISGRPKHIYSIYKKMLEKGKTFELVRDVRAVRLIVQDISTCYTALGIIHTHWRPLPGEFDDYIAAPKDNYYQSLHTAVYYDDGKPVEVQIRTPEMDDNAEFGVASHWRYKEGGKGDQSYERRINWVRKIADWQREVADSQEYLDGMKSDVFQDRVYAFTPRGDIIDMPNGSTPIDFAYHVHTQIGHRCRGAKVNGKLVTLDYPLKTGDQVEVLTAKQGGPSRDWLNSNLKLVHTARAKSKIRAWFVHQDREQNLIQGKSILDRELRRLGLQSIDLEKLARSLDLRSLDDLYDGLGCSTISIGRVVNELSESNKAPFDQLVPHPTSEKPSTDSISITGLKGLLTSFAHCCNPAPGDQIVGYITQGRGATIHRIECPNASRLRLRNPERIIQVDWSDQLHNYQVTVEIKAYDRTGLMTDISATLSDEDTSLRDIHMNTQSSPVIFHLLLEVKDIAHLSRILTRLENISNVVEAHRVNPG